MPLEHRLHARCGCASAGSVERSTSVGRPFALPTSTRHYERDRPFVIDHLALDVTLDVATKRIRAIATLDVRRIDPSADELALDAVGFEVDALTLEGKPGVWRYDGRTLLVSILPGRDKGRLTVTYRASPRRGLYFLEPDEHYPSRPRQVWSQCQEEDARHWIPCHDSPDLKMTTEVIAHVPNGWYALSNGALASSVKPKTGDFSYHWKMAEPHASYLLTLVAGEFAEIAETAKVGDRQVPVTYFVPKGREDDARRTFGHTPEMIRHFSEVTGVPYPWN
jgi:aminopeptidase N